MARKVFSNNTSAGEPGTQKEEGAAPRRKRLPLTVGGATSQKYIGPATKGHAFRTYQEIPLDQIAESQVPSRPNPDKDIESLAQSIRRYGQHIPVTVRIVNAQHPYEIVVGSRRLAAMRRLAAAGELKYNTISAFVRKMDDQQAIIAQWIENNERLDPSPSQSEVPESSPIDSAIDGATLTLTVHTGCDAEFFGFLEDRIPDLYAEWLRSREQPVSSSTLGAGRDT
jgi:ParB family chromosome partitioning protein